jgi:hypothetical protein
VTGVQTCALPISIQKTTLVNKSPRVYEPVLPSDVVTHNETSRIPDLYNWQGLVFRVPVYFIYE